MNKKRILAALLAGAMVFSMVIGMAASLGGLTAANLGADDAAVASCDTNGVTTSYTNAYSSSGTAGYKVNNVTVGGIADACDGDSLSVVLTGTGGTSLGEQTTTVPVVAGTFTATVSVSASNVLAESVTGVHVVIAD